MSDVAPVVRHMILCEDSRSNPATPHKVNIFGMLSQILLTAEHPAFRFDTASVSIWF